MNISKEDFNDLKKKIDDIHVATVENKVNSNWLKTIIGLIITWLASLTWRLFG